MRDLKRQHQLDTLPLVLITNASMFHRAHVRCALEILDANCGEIWAKLDAGTQAYYQQVNRAPFGFSQILQNITQAAIVRPLVIQSLFMRINGQPPPLSEWNAYCERLQDISAAGGQLKLIQIYTIARPPAETYVAALTDEEVDALVQHVRQSTGLHVAGFYGASE